MVKKSTYSDTFLIENAIGSFVKVFTPEPFMQNGIPQGEPFYSMTLLVTQEAATLINQEAFKIASTHYSNGEPQHPSFGWPCQPANLKPEYANNPRTAHLYMVNAKAGMDYPPQVVEPDGVKPDGSPKYKAVTDRGKVYSGAVYAVGINVYTRPQPARIGEVGQGVGVGLKVVMKTSDAEPLAGDHVDADALFAGVKVQPASLQGMAMPNGMPMGVPGMPATPAAPTPTMPAAPFVGVPGVPGLGQ